MPTLADRFRNGFNVFRDPNLLNNTYVPIGPGNSIPPNRLRLRMSTEKSVVLSLYNRIAIDVSAIAIQHVRLDQNGRFIEIINSQLNNCLTLDANIDQTGRALMQDIVMSMFDEGAVAIVPVDKLQTTSSDTIGSFDVLSLRSAKIIQWFPRHVRVNLYREETGQKEDITLEKEKVALVENPFYGIMNETNSTLKRLIQKLNILDAIDVQSGSGKLDLIIQLPYVVRNELSKTRAENRRTEIEEQLLNSKYGIVYADGTEKITQLNRPAENNLMKQVEYLSAQLASQLGITQNVMDGTADETTMMNYQNRIIEPILSAILDNMKRRFLTKTAITQGQTIKYFKSPFGLMTGSTFATAADTLTRNAIITSNEVRDVLGYPPSEDAEADQLRNKNLNPSPTTDTASQTVTDQSNPLG